MRRRFGGVGVIVILLALLVITAREAQPQCFRMYKKNCTEGGDYTSGQYADIVCDGSGVWWYRCCLNQYSEFKSSVLSDCECSAGKPVVYCDLYKANGKKESVSYRCNGCTCSTCSTGESPQTCQ